MPLTHSHFEATPFSAGREPRIGFINDDVYPSRWTNTQQTIKTAAALAHDGADVELVLRRPWNVIFEGHERRRQRLEDYYGVNAGFALTQIPGLPRSFLRLDEALHGVVAPIYSLWAGHDVVYSRKIVPLAMALATGKYVVFESHRLLREHYPMAHRAVQLLMMQPRFLGVVTNAQMIADAFIEMGFPADAVAVAHNCYDPADMEPVLDKAEARRQVGVRPDARIVCYAGHIQKRKGIETVVAMAAKAPELEFLICGGFPHDIAEAQALAASYGAGNLHFTGWVDVRRLSVYLYAADVLLIPPTAAPLRQYGNTVLPIKTYTYLAAGRPILAPRQDDIVEVLRHGSNSWLVPADDVDEAVGGLRRLFDDLALAARLAARARSDARQYTWDNRARVIRAFIRQRLEAVARPRPADAVVR